jgi:hypothetical protein
MVDLHAQEAVPKGREAERFFSSTTRLHPARFALEFAALQIQRKILS